MNQKLLANVFVGITMICLPPPPAPTPSAHWWDEEVSKEEVVGPEPVIVGTNAFIYRGCMYVMENVDPH